MSQGASFDVFLAAGGSADYDLNWPQFKHDANLKRHRNFSSQADWIAGVPDGIGRCGQYLLDCEWVGNCRHTQQEIGASAETDHRIGGETAWLTAYMCQQHYCKHVKDQQDFELSKRGRWVTPFHDVRQSYRTTRFGYQMWPVREELNYGIFSTPKFHWQWELLDIKKYSGEDSRQLVGELYGVESCDPKPFCFEVKYILWD